MCILFLLFVGSGFRIAVRADRPFSKLFAAGLTVVVGVQVFVIVGGVIRVIPLTGVTLPFVSYGGSSLVANFVLVALLLRVDDETVARQEMPPPLATARMGSGDVPAPVRVARSP
jgi:cell division protein FtsW (lipid II flippase)